jgi:hypothetical protein
MKKIILKTIFTACLLFQATCYLSAQVPTIEYVYDQAGNRVSRTIINIPPQGVKRQNPPDTVAVKIMQGERSMKLYPNPTKGTLVIEISGGNTEEDIQLTLYNGQGQTLVNKPATTGLNNLDVSNYPAGWYILQVKAGTEKKEYKIIKE